MRRRDVQLLFAHERAEFERVFGDEIEPHALPRLYVVDRRCPEGGACAARDLAYAVRGARPRVVLVARALRLSRDNILGLLRHELGHVYDPNPDEPGCEQRADDVAEWVTGKPIRYDRALVQTVGPGAYPRPRELHQ